MKKNAFSAKTLLLAVALVAVSCGNKEEAPADNQAQSVQSEPQIALNIRYIDGDSITANYNLAKDFKEASIRSYSKLESAQRSRSSEIQKFGNQIQQKINSNGYLSEASYKADVEKLQKMETDAQNYIASLQREAEQEMMQQQLQLNEAIDAFIKDYNKEKGYDAILFKSSGVYFNPALDITDEVIKGLNDRYNNVEGK